MNLIDVRRLESKRVGDPALRNDDADEEKSEGTNRAEWLPVHVRGRKCAALYPRNIF